MDFASSIDITTEGNPHEEFKLLEEIGTGSYGSVYKALWKKRSMTVAIKRVPIEEGDEEEFEDIVKEVQILQICDHSSIIKYHGAFLSEPDKELWIVIELCAFGAVTSLMSRSRRGLTEPEVAYIIRGVLRGLEYLHGRKIIHRDVKANNVLLSGEYEVKLADFGVSAQLKSTLSKKNTQIGTPFWMAPEVIKGNPYTYSADVWSVGITAIELVERVPPLADMHPMRAMFRIPMADPPTLREKEKFSPEFNDFLARCLRKDPEQRPAAAELLAHPFVRGVTGNPLCAIVDSMDQSHSDAAALSGSGTVRAARDDTGSGFFFSSDTAVPGAGTMLPGTGQFDTAVFSTGDFGTAQFGTAFFGGESSGAAAPGYGTAAFNGFCDSGTCVRRGAAAAAGDADEYVAPFLQSMRRSEQAQAAARAQEYSELDLAELETKLEYVRAQIANLAAAEAAIEAEVAARRARLAELGGE